jgi:hypothetical protein
MQCIESVILSPAVTVINEEVAVLKFFWISNDVFA